MSEDGQNRQLLIEVLSEDRTLELREALLGETLRLARRRRRFRQAQRGAAFVVVVLAGLWLVWRRPPGKLPETSSPRSYSLVRTEPMARSAVVETSTFSADRIVVSAPNAGLISTVSSEPILHEIGDADLLALAAPRAAVLVRLGPHSAELVFAEAVAGQE